MGKSIDADVFFGFQVPNCVDLRNIEPYCKRGSRFILLFGGDEHIMNAFVGVRATRRTVFCRQSLDLTEWLIMVNDRGIGPHAYIAMLQAFASDFHINYCRPTWLLICNES